MDDLEISIVIPVFNESKSIVKLYQEIRNVLINYGLNEGDWQVLFVDDGSHDDSLEILEQLVMSKSNVRFISLSRNFGHQSAIKAGIDNAGGQCVITMDGDFQHPPSQIPLMIDEWRKGADVVNMVRVGQQVGLSKNLFSKTFNKLFNSLSDFEVKAGISDFRLLDRKVVNELIKLEERNIFLRGLVSWLGFRQVELEYNLVERKEGHSKYSVNKMISLALNGLTSFSVKPLRVTGFLGLITFMIAMFYASYALYVKLMLGTAIAGWVSTLISILFIGGVQLLTIGVLGEYIGKVLIEVKQRPHYVIKKSS